MTRDHSSILNWRRLFLLFLRFLLGGIFVYASIDKILRPSEFAEIIFNYQVLPEVFINLASVILPWLEFLLGVLLIFGFWPPGTVLSCNGLLLVFFATLIFNAARGLDIDCGCFSVSTADSSGGHMLWYLLRDGLFLLLGLCLFLPIFFRRGGRDPQLQLQIRRDLMAPGERMKLGQVWRAALRQASCILMVAMALGLISNQFRSNSLPLFGEWSPETRLTLRFGKDILIPFDEAKETFISGAAVFIDARPGEEYRKGHIRGARNLPIGVFDEKAEGVLSDLPEDALIVTYCDGDKCTLSAELALKLKEIGYENVRVLFNGWTVWKEHQLPTQVEGGR